MEAAAENGYLTLLARVCLGDQAVLEGTATQSRTVAYEKGNTWLVERSYQEEGVTISD